MNIPVLKVALIEHDPLAPPGHILPLLDEWGVTYSLIRRHQKEPLPETREYSAYIFLGGEPSLLDPPQWLEEEIPFVEELFARKIPSLGICLGAQLLARALGGRVLRRKEPEIGFKISFCSKAPLAQRWLKGLSQELVFLQWHEDHFLSPPRALCILRGKEDGAHHGFVLGNTLALQGHLEVTPAVLEGWLKDLPEKEFPLGDNLLSQLSVYQPSLTNTLRVLLHRFLFSPPSPSGNPVGAG